MLTFDTQCQVPLKFAPASLTFGINSITAVEIASLRATPTKINQFEPNLKKQQGIVMETVDILDFSLQKRAIKVK